MAVINSIANGTFGAVLDGTTAFCVIAPPNGSVTFSASPTPAGSYTSVVATLVAANTYNLTLGSLLVKGAAQLFWVKATDTDGASAAVSVWVRFGTNIDLANEIPTQIQSFLIDNKALIDSRIAPYAPVQNAVIIEQIITGMPQELGLRKPVIDIQLENLEEEFYELPLTRVVSPTVSIISFVYHQNDISWRQLMTAIGYAIRDILNRVSYLEFTLPSSLVVTKGAVTSMRIHEGQDGDRFVAAVEISWQAEISVPDAT